MTDHKFTPKPLNADFSLVYNVRYTPKKYRVVPQFNGTHHFWGVCDTDSGAIALFAFEENIARTAALALEIVNAHVNGDMKEATELLRALERMRQ